MISLINHEITLKILEFILNSIEKVKLGSLFSSMCMLPGSNRKKFWSHNFYFQNSGILETRMDQRGDPMKMNFDNLQRQKWIIQTVRAQKVNEKSGHLSSLYLSRAFMYMSLKVFISLI